MSEVEIVFPKGREAAVRRLHDALAEAGYDVGSRDVEEGDPVSAGGGASAVLILWDRSTMAHSGLHAAATAARNRHRAIDVSVDGITPLDLDDDRGLVHLSGWRGDPHHPGWRKIMARLDELCSRRAAPITRPAAAPRSESRPATAGRAEGDRAAQPGAGKAVLAAAAGVLLLIVVVAALLMSERPPAESPAAQPPPSDSTSPSATSQAAPAAPAAQEAPPKGAPTSQPATVPAPPRQPAAAIGEAAVPPAAQSPEASQAEPLAATGSPVAEQPRTAKAPRDRRRPAIRYTRYSRNMRLFCARAGRHTPQCRIFNEATAP